MRKFAFLDLDMTLFDYSAAREGATLAALTAINEIVRIDVQQTFEIVTRILIPYGDLLVDIDFPNFRRQWKSPELFALCLLLNEEHLFDQLKKLIEPLSEVFAKTHSVDGITVAFERKMENRRSLKKVTEDLGLRDMRSKYVAYLDDPKRRPIINAAIEGFDKYLKTEVRLFDGTKELLRVLESNGFEIAILSEGDEKIQKGKAEVLGLPNLVNSIFVSSSCCRSEDLLNWLWALSIDAKNGSKQNLLEAITVVFNAVIPYSIKSETWFRKVLHSMLLPKKEQLDFYESFGWLSENEIASHEPTYIVLIGDRYDKDIYPALLAFTNAVTVRLLYGKYKNAFSQGVLKERGLPAPTATVNSIIEATEFLEAAGKTLSQQRSARDVSIINDERAKDLSRAIEIIQGSINELPTQLREQLAALNTVTQGINFR